MTAVSQRVAARFAATRSIEQRFGTPMLMRLGLTLTATPSESRPTTSPDRKATRVPTRRLPCEVRPVPLTTPSEGKAEICMNTGRDCCERGQEIVMKPVLAGLTSAGAGATRKKAPTRF